jgi:predicted NAD/FAD-binding protein
MSQPRLAIVGTGIAGLGCAHFLQRDYDLTLFEAADYIGGHTNTVHATEPGTGRAVPIDTGFMVFNHATYPLLTRLFHELRVATKKTDMSFSVRHADSGLEFCGSSLNHLFAQRRNLLRPRFYRMLAAIHRFNQEAVAALADPTSPIATETLGDYVKRRGYGTDFFDLYLVPMSSAVWSTPPEKMLGFPAADEELFRKFVHDALERITEEPGTFAGIDDLGVYILAQIQDHRANPRDDLTSYLLNVEIEGQPVNDEIAGGKAGDLGQGAGHALSGVLQRVKRGHYGQPTIAVSRGRAVG